MESAIFLQALRENTRFRRILPWIVLGILGAVLGHYWNTFQPDSTKVEQYASVSSIFVFRILALTSAILTSTIMTQEVEQKTIVYLLTRPVARWKLLGFRYLACSLSVAFLGWINVLLLSVAVYGDFTSNSLLTQDLAAVTVGAFAYGVFFMLIGLFFNRAMIVCLLFAFGWETAVPNMPGQMSYVSISSYLQAISQHPTSKSKGIDLLASSAGDNTISSSTGYISMLIFVVALVALSMWWFTTFEYLPREDAE